MTRKTIYRQWNEINTTYVSIKSLKLNGRESRAERAGSVKCTRVCVSGKKGIAVESEGRNGEHEKLDLIVSRRVWLKRRSRYVFCGNFS